MKQKNYKVDAEKRIDWIITFIRKYLKLEETENLVSLKVSPVHPKLVFCLGENEKDILGPSA